MALVGWVLIGFGVAFLARLVARRWLPLGYPGAAIAGALGAICGGTLESLIAGASGFELVAGTAAAAAAGAGIVLVLFARAGVSDPFPGRPGGAR